MALILSLSSGEMGCRQLVGIHDTQLGSEGGEGGALDLGTGGVSAADGGLGGRSSTSEGGSGGRSSQSGGNSGSGGARGTGGAGAAPAGGGSGTGGRQAGGAGTGGMGTGGADAGGSPAGAAGAGGAPAKKPYGSACRMNADCENDLCGAEWVCCNANCNGQCESCVTASSPGKCVPVTTPRTPCEGSGTCGGLCDGVHRNSCLYPGSETTCGQPSCNNGSARAAATCDSKGACATPAVTTCESGCNGSACAPTCHHPSTANLLTNPGFDGSLSPWVFSSAVASYSPHDYGGCLTSGSGGLDSGAVISQCVRATAGVMYWMSYRFKGRDDAQTYETSMGSCGVIFLSGTNLDCLGGYNLGASLQASVTSVGGAWATASGAGGPAPAGTGTMSFSCTGTTGRGYYDLLYLGTATAPNF